MSDPSWAIQQAIYAAVSAAVSVPVYDDPPADAALPYLTIGDDTVVPSRTKTEDGHEITVTVHAWSLGRGRKGVKELLSEVYDVLNDKDLSVPGFSVVDVSFEYADSFRDADGLTWHGVARYRVITEE